MISSKTYCRHKGRDTNLRKRENDRLQVIKRLIKTKTERETDSERSEKK